MGNTYKLKPNIFFLNLAACTLATSIHATSSNLVFLKESFLYYFIVRL